jgi:hypothetical protein
VRSDDASIAVFKRANELARSEIDDQAARDELRRLAGSRHKTLERAEKMSRLGRRHLESGARAEHVHRLLSAALHDTPVARADPVVLAQIAMLREAFAKDRAPDDVWAQLLAAEPRLQAFLDDVRGGRFGEKFDPFMSSEEQQTDPERGRRAYEALTGDLGLAAALKRVVGPQAESTDTLIGSQRAYDLVHRRLLEERPEPR